MNEETPVAPAQAAARAVPPLAEAVPEPVAAAEADVPARLVSTAIALYGERGTRAVSSRAIQRAAGVLNEAAVRYYFRDRMGLLEACLARIAADFAPLIDEAWAELETLRQADELQVRNVVQALVYAFHALHQQDRPAVQLVARMIREDGEAGQDLLLRHFGPVIWRFEGALASLLPGKSPSALRLHAFLAINSVVNGMVDQSLLWRLPATDDNQAHYSLRREVLAEGFIEYVTAGLCAPSAID